MSDALLQTQPKFPSHSAARPMLSRDADSMYWMSRYVERTEHVARLLLVNSNLLYWSVRAEDARSRFEESPDDYYRHAMVASNLFQGLTDQTLPHDQGWQ